MPPLQVGKILRNRYRISKVLYQSKLTNVYTAEDVHLVGNIWAIKEMKFLAMDSLERQNIIAQFEREVRKMTELSHPNLARVIDFFVDGQNLYIIREFIPAYDIKTLMNKTSGPLREREVLSWGIQIADVLNYLYSKKFPAVFYRELNLTNILVNADGVVKLIDMGLARVFQTETNPEALKRLGSMEYASPEQFEEDGIFDQRSLVYNLGAMLFHMLTRQSPAQNMFNIPEVEEYNPDVSPATARIIKRATQYDHRLRYQSLSEMRRDLIKARKNPEVTLEFRSMVNEKKETPNIWNYILGVIAVLLAGGIVYIAYKLFF